ncbi:MAG TPA: hypothetical protein VI636_07625 [Candidatus Angelobacter sp.]
MQLLSTLSYLVEKTVRAKTHLDALNRELDIYLKDSHTVITKEDTQNSRYIRRTELKPMSTIIGMLLGEFLYSLRSGLDQLAWQLALPTSRQNSERDVYFPIVADVSNPNRLRTHQDRLKLFPDEVAREIDAVQPYKGGSSAQDHPLWYLHLLCNFDKHRVIPINSRGVDIFVPHNPAVLIQHFNDEDAVEVSIPFKDKWQFDFDPGSTMTIEFGEWDTDFGVPRQKVTDIHGFFTNTIIPRFSRFNARAVATPEIRILPGKTIYSK